jgi:hypothetical protein
VIAQQPNGGHILTVRWLQRLQTIVRESGHHNCEAFAVCFIFAQHAALTGGSRYSAWTYGFV